MLCEDESALPRQWHLLCFACRKDPILSLCLDAFVSSLSCHLQNEYLIYDQTQVRLRYLVLVRLLDPATVGQRPAPTPSALPQTAVQSISAASLIPAGMSEDDMISAAIAASLCGGAGRLQGGGAGTFQGGTCHQPLVVPDSD